MQCDSHCLPFPITVEAWTPETEILINPSGKMALTFSSMVVDTGFVVFQGLSAFLSDRLKPVLGDVPQQNQKYNV